jgi:hypothetical protein
MRPADPAPQPIPAKPAYWRHRLKVSRNGRYDTIRPSRMQTVRWP